MQIKYGFLLIIGLLLLSACEQDPLVREFPEAFNIQIDNTGGPDRIDKVIVLSLRDILAKHPEFNPMAFVVVDGNKELANQVNDVNADHKVDEIVFLCDLTAGESKQVTLRFSKDGSKSRDYTKRTQAELSHKVGGKFIDRKYEGGEFQNVEYLVVPPEHTDHSFFIRYEGPGWESDKVGYRFYLDWRNATDIFGKKTHEMVLQDVGLDGFDSYHEMSDWGMDILKVGDSFGIGSWGMWADNKANRVSETDTLKCTILANGPVQSKILTEYVGWRVADNQYDLEATLSINAGSRKTLCELDISGEPENLCTGIVKHDSARALMSGEEKEGWLYFATYGKQSLADDKLGMAVFYKKTDLAMLTNDDLSHLIVLKPDNGKVNYYFAAAWEKEPGGIKTEQQFIDYLNDTVNKLDNPVEIRIN